MRLLHSKTFVTYLIICIVTVLAFTWYLYKPQTTAALVAQVVGQNTGEHSETANTLPNLAYPGSVTNGNTIIVMVTTFSSGIIPTINTPTKASGAATISAFTLDKTATGTSGASNFRISIYRATVTATGNLTIGFTVTADDSIAAINEYSGMAASPVDGTPVSNTGTSATESTGSIVTSTCGVVIMTSTEVSTTNFAYTQSDTDIYNSPNGTTAYTGENQHKITSVAGTYTLTAGNAHATWFWLAVGVAYSAASCTAPIIPPSIVVRGGNRPASVVSAVKIRGGGSRPNDPYSTTFPATENPISESGVWLNGLATGLDWANVRTTTNLAFGTESGTVQFDDSTAVLSNVGTWGPNQTVQATVVVNRSSTSAGTFEEVELRLRSNISAHSNTGYEIDCSVNTFTNNRYVEVVRWNGALGSFTHLDSRTQGCANGDILKGTAIGNVITVFINGASIFSVTDNTYHTGSPGIGFYFQDDFTDLPADPVDYGFSAFSATDGTRYVNVNFR